MLKSAVVAALLPIAVLIAIFVLYTEPTLLLFAISGLGVHFLITRRARIAKSVIAEQPGRSNISSWIQTARQLILGIAEVSAIVIVLVLISCGPIDRYEYTLEVPYESNITYTDSVWTITESVDVSPDSTIHDYMAPFIEHITGRAPRHRQADQTIVDVLREEGWAAVGGRDRAIVLRRQREEALETRWHRTREIVSIPYHPLQIRYGFDYLSLVPAPSSTVTVRVRRYMILGSFPAGSRADALDGVHESYTMDARDIAKAGELRLDLAGPLLRNRLGSIALGVSVWTPLKWLVLALLALFGQRITDTYLSPLVRRILKPIEKYAGLGVPRE